MLRPMTRAVLLCSLLFVAGCGESHGDDAGPSVDSGAGADAGTDAGSDAGSDSDAGSGTDAGSGSDAGSGLDAGVGSDAGTCSIIGDHQTDFTGTPVFLRFLADGSWSLAPVRADLGTAMIGGTYMLAGSALTIVDTRGTSCPATVVGMYTLMWSPTCSMFSLTLVSDPCTDRGTALGGSTLTRL
jgi:hypothetical protein